MSQATAQRPAPRSALDRLARLFDHLDRMEDGEGSAAAQTAAIYHLNNLENIGLGHGLDRAHVRYGGGDEAIAEAILTEFVDDLAG